MTPPEPCPTCAQPRDAHGDRCPQGEIERLRARVEELEAKELQVADGYNRLAARAGVAEGRARAAQQRVAELEVAVEPDGARRLELAKQLAISSTNLLRIERDDARARADAAELRAAPAVTDAMVQAAINSALERSGHLDQHIVCDWCHLNSPYPRYAEPARERVFRAALEAALGTPAGPPTAEV